MRRAIWPSIVVLLLLVCASAEALAASVTLAWDGTPGLRYMVYYGTKPGVYTRSADAKDRHAIIIDGLADNQMYYFVVRAYDNAGHVSEFSKEIRKSTKLAATLPVAPPADRKETPAPAPVNVPQSRPEPAKETTAPAVAPNPVAVSPPPALLVTPSSPLPPSSSPSPSPTPSSSTPPLPPPSPSPRPAPRVPVSPPPPAAVDMGPPGYLIGTNDVLAVTFWRDKEMNADVVVRPDGNITLPLLNDIQAAGLTPAQLRDRILAEAQRYIEDPSPTVAVKEIKSRNVFITGQVDKPGAYPLAGPTTVLQLIAMAGGLKEFADGKNIVVMRTENGRQVAYQVDYKELLKRKNLRQNIDLKPGDTVVVP